MQLMAKPLTGFSSDVFQLAHVFRGDAFRVVFAMLLGPAVWVIHAFQKQLKTGSRSRNTKSTLSMRGYTSEGYAAANHVAWKSTARAMRLRVGKPIRCHDKH